MSAPERVVVIRPRTVATVAGLRIAPAIALWVVWIARRPCPVGPSRTRRVAGRRHHAPQRFTSLKNVESSPSAFSSW
jgi:hypothetical protein